jgi:hypothetical protein
MGLHCFKAGHALVHAGQIAKVGAVLACRQKRIAILFQAVDAASGVVGSAALVLPGNTLGARGIILEAGHGLEAGHIAVAKVHPC